MKLGNFLMVFAFLFCTLFVIPVVVSATNPKTTDEEYEIESDRDIRNGTYTIENVEFKRESTTFLGFLLGISYDSYDVYIDTSDETLVINYNLIEFTKTDKDVSFIKIDNSKEKNLIHLNKKLAKEVSKTYADIFKETMFFTE